MQGTTIEIPMMFVLLGGVVLASVLVAKLPSSEITWVKRSKARLGLGELNSGLFLLMLFYWGTLFLFLFLGLLWTIYEAITAAIPADDAPDQIWSWRFSVLKLASLTAVLGAVVALPFTLLRLSLTRQQVDTARDSLFNDKIDAAVTDLYAQRQVTVGPDDDGKYVDVWQDDITRRNGAIDRLEGLVAEDRDLSPRVIRMLSVYVRELSRNEAQAEKVPEGLEGDALFKWAQELEVKRSDMEKAVQTLGRLPVFKDDQGQETRPDLTGANLQAMSLSGLNFDKAQLGGAQLQGAYLSAAQLQWAHLSDAQLQGAYLSEAQLQGAGLIRAQLQGAHLNSAQLQGANLSAAQLQGANLSAAQFDDDTALTAATLRGAAVWPVDFTNVPQIEGHLEHLFGDATVKLPEGMKRPDRFNESYADWDDFETAWRAFQRSIGQDPDNPE